MLRASHLTEMLGGEGEVSLDAWTAELAARLQLDSPYASRQPSVTVEVDPPPSGTAGAPEVLPPPPGPPRPISRLGRKAAGTGISDLNHYY